MSTAALVSRIFRCRCQGPGYKYRAMATKSYKDAIDKLNSLQTNAATLEAVRASGGRSSAFAIPEMLEYLGRIGYSPDDLNALNVIHITGTKGKGSTSAFTDSILRHVKQNWKIGLYTSPHLVAVRERIRINGTPLSEEDFAKFFFEVWDKLEANTMRQFDSTSAKPVDATILEVGVGGTYDSTNIVPKPVVTGITSLGIDHVNVLGKTLGEIAWQKGGIFKEGVPALTVEQPEEGMSVLKKQAEELKASRFEVVSLVPGITDIKLGLAGVHQFRNASLAVHLTKAFLASQDRNSDSNISSDLVVKGLVATKWPGRCQSIADPVHRNTVWNLDGAHTAESLDCCMEWYVSAGIGLPQDTASKRTTRVLVFNCTSGRSGGTFLGSMITKIAAQLKLLEQVGSAGSFFAHVVFCANVTYADGEFKGDLTTLSIPTADLAELKTQQQLASSWSALIPAFAVENIHVLPSIEHAVNLIRTIESDSDTGVNVLVTGSLHLVGGVIEVAGLSEVAL